ncbi:MAG: TolB family protein, partial [Candidatus Zixiibacteriota bacterium]
SDFKPVPRTIDSNPSWSRAGNRIVFASTVDSAGNIQPGLYLTDTTGIAKTYTGFPGLGLWAEWLPGDSELIVAGGQLVRFNLNTRQITPLGVFPRFPPFDITADGIYVYYEAPKIDSTSPAGIYRFDLNTGDTITVVPGVHPAISEDGERLALSRSPLYTFNLTDSSLKLIVIGGILPEWLGSDTILFYAGDSLRLADTLGSSVALASAWPRKLTANKGKSEILFTKVSSDFATRIWKIKSDGSGLIQLTRE